MRRGRAQTALSPDAGGYSLSMADLITSAYCSTVVPSSTAVNTQTLAALISAVSDAIERYCRREFVPTRLIELYDSPDQPYLMLRQTPVLALNSVTLFPTGLNPIIYTAGQFALRPQVGRISFRPYAAGMPEISFPCGLTFRRLNAVEVDYIAGFGFTTDSAAAIPAGAQIVTPAAMIGLSINQPWAISAGTMLVVDPGSAVQETVTVSAVTADTFTALFTQPHAAGTVICGVLIPDDIALAAALAVGNVLNAPDLTKQRESQGKTIGYEYLARVGDLMFTAEILNILNRYRDSVV